MYMAVLEERKGPFGPSARLSSFVQMSDHFDYFDMAL